MAQWTCAKNPIFLAIFFLPTFTFSRPPTSHAKYYQIFETATNILVSYPQNLNLPALKHFLKNPRRLRVFPAHWTNSEHELVYGFGMTLLKKVARSKRYGNNIVNRVLWEWGWFFSVDTISSEAKSRSLRSFIEVPRCKFTAMKNTHFVPKSGGRPEIYIWNVVWCLVYNFDDKCGGTMRIFCPKVRGILLTSRAEPI